jgi:lambda repressor-like predicted transcriptional regulator
MARVGREASEWARLVAAYKASGLSASAFAAREGLALSTLYEWVAKLAPRQPVLRIARVIRRPSHAGDEATPTAMGGAVVIEVGAARLRVGAGFDRATLAAVLDVLEARGRGGL